MTAVCALQVLQVQISLTADRLDTGANWRVLAQSQAHHRSRLSDSAKNGNALSPKKEYSDLTAIANSLGGRLSARPSPRGQPPDRIEFIDAGSLASRLRLRDQPPPQLRLSLRADKLPSPNHKQTSNPSKKHKSQEEKNTSLSQITVSVY